MQGSQRRGELSAVTTVDVVDPLTVRINTTAPFAPLLATLTDRSGMMVSPKAAKALGDKFATAPVCSGAVRRSEEHTSELQSLMRISYAVFCLKKKNDLIQKPKS